MGQNEFKQNDELVENPQPEIIEGADISVTTIEVEEAPSVRAAKYHYLIFVFGILALFSISLLVDYVLSLFNITLATNNILYASLSNFFTYVILFASFIAFLAGFKLLKPLAKQFTKLKPFVYGLFYGFVIILASVSYNLLTGLIFPDSTSNINQSSIELIIQGYPIMSFVWIVLVGPVIEEIIYRLGLFEGVRKKSRVFGYVVSGIIFGFIHFNIPFNADRSINTAALINEFINVPSYVLSGLLFAYTYEKIGFAGSSVAHISNNLLSYILTIIRIYAEK